MLKVETVNQGEAGLNGVTVQMVVAMKKDGFSARPSSSRI